MSDDVIIKCSHQSWELITTVEFGTVRRCNSCKCMENFNRETGCWNRILTPVIDDLIITATWPKKILTD